jgi:hypothetical protein
MISPHCPVILSQYEVELMFEALVASAVVLFLGLVAYR